MQNADLPVSADQRLLSVCGEQLRHRDVDVTDSLHRRRVALGRLGVHRLYPVRRQVSPAQLRRPHRGRHALQLEIASCIQCHPVARGYKACHQLLHQDLPGSSRRRQSARDHHGHAVQVLSVGDRLARCHSHPGGDPDSTVGGVQALDRRLDGGGGAQGAQGALESRHGSVAERLYHPTSGEGDRSAHILLMGAAHSLHAIVAQLGKQRGRVDQVAEHDNRHPAHPGIFSHYLTSV